MSDLLPIEDSGLIARLDAVTKRADGGDKDALGVIAQLFDTVPSLWDAYANLSAAAEDALVELYSGDSVLTREGLRRRLAAMRNELAGTDVSPLERLLVERVVACWLLSYHADFAYARALKELPPREADLYQRRQDRAARQYLKALRSLAMVRRLHLPALQVNVASTRSTSSGRSRRTPP